MEEDPLNQQADDSLAERIDRELEAALAVQASPTVTRHVLGRTATMTPRYGRPPLWWLAPIAAGLFGVFMFYEGFGRYNPPRDVAPDITTRAAPPLAQAAGPVEREPTVVSRTRRPARPPQIRRRPARDDTPVAVISREEQRGWQQFLAFAAQGPIEVQTTVVPELQPIEPVRIAAIEFDDISLQP
jgi:hypothetical protein